MLPVITEAFDTIHGWIFENAVVPMLHGASLTLYLEDAHMGLEWLLIGLLELAILYLLLRPLEAKVPAQVGVTAGARWNDFTYTVVHRIGVFAVALFFLLDPVVDAATSWLHVSGINQFNVETLVPGVTDVPIVSFMLYLVILDFVDYWYHRGSHSFRWWWALHSLHHSQQQMNLWSDNRNHLLDDFLRDAVIALIALGVGVPPNQYWLLVVVTRMLESMQHANIRVNFGHIGDRLLVSPRYHRTHHAIGIGHEKAGTGRLGGCNFATLFPVWDILFKTANFQKGYAMTGIRDQLPPPRGKLHDYGDTFWRQQWLGLVRLLDAFAKRR